MATYGLDDGNGNCITTGLQEHEARRVAQRMADERGKPLYLYALAEGDGEPGESEEIVPAGQFANRFDQAIEGLRIAKEGGVVRVQDSETTWLCRARAWHAAQAQLSSQAPLEDEEDGGMTGEQAAYAALCRAVSSPIISVGGSDRGSEADRQTLARWADKAGLLPEGLRPMLEER